MKTKFLNGLGTCKMTEFPTLEFVLSNPTAVQFREYTKFFVLSILHVNTFTRSGRYLKKLFPLQSKWPVKGFLLKLSKFSQAIMLYF